VPDSFDEYPVYNGDDLGVRYTPQQTVCKLWAPSATAVKMHLYETGLGGQKLSERFLKKAEAGVWETILKGDQEGKFYTFQTRVKERWRDEVPDPYAVATGVNGRRGMIVDMNALVPKGWDNDRRPILRNPTDIILYELHIRDLSTHPSAGISSVGKYLGLAEVGTQSPQGLATGLSHIKELGVTHVHLLPAFDYTYRSVDETRLSEPQFNWGYDPQNYNVPEGSYATDPDDGRVRIREFREMVKAMHDNGLRVVMDVVYNHTGFTDRSLFNQLVPGYYYRQRPDGSFSDASACGNETASDRDMVRKFIVDSVKHWVTNYHIDGFRFDLMAIHDIETMNAVSESLHAIDPTIYLYGEGWTAGDSPLPKDRRSLKKHTLRLNQVAAFSDDIRDGLKGSVFEHQERGFASGKPGMEESVKFGIVAATQHPQLNYRKVNYSKEPWAGQPSQCVNYVSCHDNHTLWDRLQNSNPDASEADRIRMDKLAQAIVLTSQGVPFLHAGAELLRTKAGSDNSYNQPDAINQIDWTRKTSYREVFDYYRDLVKLRTNHPAFRMPTTELIQRNLRFLDSMPDLIVGYELNGKAAGDQWQRILVLFNGSFDDRRVTIPDGNWAVVLDGKEVNEQGIRRNASATLAEIKRSSALILIDNL
jgi:pullulanase